MRQNTSRRLLGNDIIVEIGSIDLKLLIIEVVVAPEVNHVPDRFREQLTSVLMTEVSHQVCLCS